MAPVSRVSLVTVFVVTLQAFSAQGMDADDDAPEQYITEFDKDGDGLVSFTEIHDGVQALSGEDATAEDQKHFDEKFKPMLEEHFPKADTDGDGKLTAKELGELMLIFEKEYAAMEEKEEM